ncbi:MAG TPA: DUF4157 domain-containing protein [Kofleriaceae bacterium]|nr:DUF4157 domain-containing protein [Kofleriaceae bacterium]
MAPGRAPAVQAKSVVGPVDDPLEREADRIAEQVMRMAAPPAGGPPAATAAATPSVIRRACRACGKPRPAASSVPVVRAAGGRQDELIQRKCARCEEDEVRRKAAGEQVAAGPAPASVDEVVRSPGEPLDGATRAFMEPRFGHDFGRVRVHATERAGQSAHAIDALAYTAGEHIVFAPGQWQPGTARGRQLLAHELAHVVQQRGRGAGLPGGTAAMSAVSSEASPASAATIDGAAAAREVAPGRPTWAQETAQPAATGAAPVVQRKCRGELGAPSPDCTPSDDPVIGTQFLFRVGCDDLLPGPSTGGAAATDPVTAFATGLRAGTSLRVHGYASVEGDPGRNLDLSCHRANKVAQILRTARPDCPVTEVLKHGAQDRAPAREFWRSVIVEMPRAAPSTEEPPPPPPAPCTTVPTATPSTCEGRHDGYAAAARCFPLNMWLPCADRASADVCRAIHAFRFEGTEGTLLRACVGAQPFADPAETHAKGDWLDDTNRCIWGHWRAALDAMHNPALPVPSTLTPEWADAVRICRTDGVGSGTCCQAHVVAEQNAIDRCGPYPTARFGLLPTDVPGAPVCSATVALSAGGLPFTGNFGSVRDRIVYGFLRCCSGL